MVTACDELGMGDAGPGASSGGVGATGGLGGTGMVPPVTSTSGTSTTGGAASGGTDGCGVDDTAADPWGDEDGCGGGLPTSSPWDVGGGGNCWAHLENWNESCEEAPCLDYDCQSPPLCGSVTFGDCSGSGGAATTSDSGDATTGGPELEVDDPEALECILQALSEQVLIRFTITECDPSTSSMTYEIVSNGLVITTMEEAYGDNHFREQRIATFNDTYDFESCLGAGVSNYEKRFCVGMADSGPCPVGPVACP